MPPAGQDSDAVDNRVIIGLDALNLDLSINPGHRVNSDPPIGLTRAYPMPDSMASAADPGRVGPAALESLRVFWPAELEWFQVADVADLDIGRGALAWKSAVGSDSATGQLLTRGHGLTKNARQLCLTRLDPAAAARLVKNAMTWMTCCSRSCCSC